MPKATASDATLTRVHLTTESVATVELTPPHPPRVETPEYARAHHFLTVTKNSPCRVCKVTRRTLRNPKLNPFGAKALETHHYPIERSLVDACDPVKVHQDFPTVYDRATLNSWVDSPANLIVLCDIHHRSTTRGIHHLLAQDFAIQPYLLDGYQIAAAPQEAATVEQQDDQIEQAAQLEQAS